MGIVLTGATGYIGSAVLEALLADGHDVIAVVRSESAAERVATTAATTTAATTTAATAAATTAAATAATPASGGSPRPRADTSSNGDVTAIVGDVTDATWFAGVLAGADGAIHAAAPEADAEGFNAAVVEAAVRAYAGTGKRFVLTSGVWEYGAGVIDDDVVGAPPELTAWRVPIEQRLLDSEVDAVVLAPGVVYGRRPGLLNLITEAPTSAAGEFILLGDGEQHWSFVHVDDLARLYVVALTHPAASGRLVGVDGSPVTVRAIAEAAVVASGAAGATGPTDPDAATGPTGVVTESIQATRDRLGAAFADALLLDQVADGAKARSLGWVPLHPSVLDEVARPSGAKVPNTAGESREDPAA